MQGPKDMFYKVVAHVDFFFFFLDTAGFKGIAPCRYFHLFWLIWLAHFHTVVAYWDTKPVSLPSERTCTVVLFSK